MRKIIINEKGREIRCAMFEDDHLVEIHQSNSSDDEIVGNIYIGRVKKVLPGMQAAFVDIGLSQNGYLHRNDLLSFQQSKQTEAKPSISHYVKEGEKILVQVVKIGTDQKGPKLTMNLEFGGHLLVYMPYGNYMAVSKKVQDERERNRLLDIAQSLCQDQEGLLFRTASMERSKEVLEKEYNQLKQKFLKVIKQTSDKPVCLVESKSFIDRTLSELVIKEEDLLISDQIERVQQLKLLFPHTSVQYHELKEGIFSTYKIEQEIEKLLKPLVWLKSGAYIIIEQTEAMTIIDVNTGKFSGKLSMRDTVLKTNELAAIEIAKQIRLRNLSGMILIDFIDMKHKQDQMKVLETMKLEMKKDRVQHKVIGFTELNILQITRKKTRKPLERTLTELCTTCRGLGRIVSAESVAYKLERELWEYQFMDKDAMWIEATGEVIDLVKGKNEAHLNKLEDVLKYKIIFTEIVSHVPTYSIKQMGDVRSIMEKISS
ncbi:MAG TPA: Rne/Rng family ribonuclease [Metabacillus sp.]|nr:Rne/Rng family ribonuclease [Metabacillus sp.]